MAFSATRTNRNTWHVKNEDTLEHFECANQAEVEEAIKLYNETAAQREADRLAAEEAARNPQVGEFGTTVPGEPAMFEHTVGNAGKAIAPAAADEAAGAERTFTTEELQAILAVREAADATQRAN